jgi:hypothetical protein
MKRAKTEPVEPKSVDEIKKLIKEHHLDIDSGSKSRELLIEGLDNIKGRIEYNKKLKEAGGVCLNVEHMGGWVHNLIRDTLGGKINSSKQTVMWEIDDRIVEWDPRNGNLEYAS